MRWLKVLFSILCFMLVSCFFVPEAYAITMEDGTQISEITEEVYDWGSQYYFSVDYNTSKEIVFDFSDPEMVVLDCSSDSGFVKTEIEGNVCRVTTSGFGNFYLNIGYGPELATGEDYRGFYVQGVSGAKEAVDLISKHYYVSKDVTLAEYLNFNQRSLMAPSGVSMVTYGCNLDAESKTYSCDGTVSVDMLDISSKITFSGKIIGMFPANYYNSWGFTYTQEVDTANPRYFEISYEDITMADLYFYSEDESIAKVKGNAVYVVGVGTTYVHVYNLVTNQRDTYTVVGTPKSRDLQVTPEEMAQKFDNMPQTIELDAANLDYWLISDKNNINYQMIYENWVIKHLYEDRLQTSGSRTVYCSNGNTCYINLEHYYNGVLHTYSNQINPTTITIHGVGKGYMTYRVGEWFYLEDMLPAFLRENETVTYEYDETKLGPSSYQDGAYEFKDFGNITITAKIGDDYSQDFTFLSLIKQEDYNAITDYFESLGTLTVDYQKGDLDLVSLANAVKEKFLENFPEEYKAYALVEVECITDERCLIHVDSEDEVFGYFSPNLHAITYTGTNTSLEGLTEVTAKIEDLYILTVDDYIKVMENVSGTNELYYDELTEYTGLSAAVDNTNFTISFEHEKKLTMKGLPTDLETNVIIKSGEKEVFCKKVTIKATPILQMDMTLESTDEAKNEFVSAYLDNLLGLTGISSIVNISETDPTIIEVNTGGNYSYNLILYKASQVNVNSMSSRYSHYEMSVGDTSTIEIRYYPTNATVFPELEYEVLNEDVVSVDENGVMTAKAAGYSVVKINYSKYSYATILVLVDMELVDFLNLVAADTIKEVVITYDRLNHSTLEQALSYELERYSTIDDVYPYLWISAEVEKVNDKYQFRKYFQSQYDYQLYYSDYYDLTHELKGIYVEKQSYSLNVGQTVKANISFTEGDNNNLYFRSDDPTIATIAKDGTITGLKEGITRINVYDKKSAYFNYFTVYVSLDYYMQNATSKVKEIEPLLIEPWDGRMSEENHASSNYGSVLGQYIPAIYYSDNGAMSECDVEAKTCTYTYSLNGNEYRHTFAYDYAGVAIKFAEDDSKDPYNDVLYFAMGDTYQVNAENFTTNTDQKIYYESTNPDVCTIDDAGLLTAKAKGYAIIKATNADGRYDFFRVVIDEDALAADIDTYWNANMPTELDIPMVKYTGLGESYVESEMYYVVIQNLLKDYIADGSTYYFDFDLEDLKNDELNVTIAKHFPYEDPDILLYASWNIEGTKTYNIKVNYLEENPVADENLATIIENVKSSYTLKMAEGLKYKMDKSSGQFGSIYEYCGEFLDTIKVNSHYDVLFDARAGGGDPYSASEMGFYIILYDGMPVYAGESSFSVRYDATDEVPKEQEEFIDYLTDLVMSVYESLISQSPYRSYTMASARSVMMPPVPAAEMVAKEGEPNINIEYVGQNGIYEVYAVDVNDLQFGIEVARETSEEYSNDVTNITTNVSNLKLKVGESSTITYKVVPSDATSTKVTWSSSNTKVVKVSGGKVIAVGEGKAVIKIKAEAGGFVKEIPVTVTAAGKVGDANVDGKVNINDLIQLRQHMAGIITLSGQGLKNVDVNKDSKVNINDLIRIRKYLAGMESL